MGSIKASILILYHQVFFVSRRFTRMLWAVGIFVIGYSGVLGGASLIQCLPLDYIWDHSVKGYCLDIPLAATILAVFNVLTDIIILIMPMPMLWKMQMKNREKFQIMGMFLLGGLYASLHYIIYRLGQKANMNSVSFCSLWRTVIIHEENWEDPGCKQTTYLLNILSTANPRTSRGRCPFGHLDHGRARYRCGQRLPADHASRVPQSFLHIRLFK